MLQLPPALATHYRPATDLEVRSWSFGALRLPRDPNAGGWERQRHTLDDQAIFGPLRDLECACGKYQGPSYDRMICDRCGVKVTTRDARRKRFGHIELPHPVPHPLGAGEALLSAVPVLPAAYFQSDGGERVAALYDDLLRSLDSDAPEELAERVRRVMALLVPVVVVAHEWNLREAVTLACGLALVLRSTSGDGCCVYCGYPLAGLPTGICPGCGRVLRPGG